MTRRHDAKGRSRHGPPFIQLFRHLVSTEAWRTLRPAGRVVYLAIAERYDGTNNGRLAASVRDLADECAINKDTATSALKELVARGFIERAQEGSFSCKVRLAAEYRLTCYRCDRTGQPATNAFRLWSGGNEAAIPEGLHAAAAE